MNFSNFCSLDFLIIPSITCGRIERDHVSSWRLSKKLPISEAPRSAAYFYGMRNIAINLENERREKRGEERGADPKPIDQPRKSIGGGGGRLALPLTDRQIGPDSVLHFLCSLFLGKASRILTGKHNYLEVGQTSSGINSLSPVLISNQFKHYQCDKSKNIPA